MNKTFIKEIKETSRAKVLFTLESSKPLRIRAFTWKGCEKIARFLGLSLSQHDKTFIEFRNKYNNPTILVRFDRTAVIIKKQ